jgi:hypothetical protein
MQNFDRIFIWPPPRALTEGELAARIRGIAESVTL